VIPNEGSVNTSSLRQAISRSGSHATTTLSPKIGACICLNKKVVMTSPRQLVDRQLTPQNRRVQIKLIVNRAPQLWHRSSATELSRTVKVLRNAHCGCSADSADLRTSQATSAEALECPASEE
ncbi:hypothetical protein J0S82_014948, partial [Galemys pyrenaicus]